MFSYIRALQKKDRNNKIHGDLRHEIYTKGLAHRITEAEDLLCANKRPGRALV